MSEVRLIDKGALIRKMLEVLEEGWGYQELFDAVENAPTIDPVKRGRWKYKAARTRSVYFMQHVQCNRCGHIRPRLTGDILRYCPNCGAKMDVHDNDVGKTEGEEDEQRRSG